MTAMNHKPDPWKSADAYENFMGRWSRVLAQRFVEWLEPPPGMRWLDVGCGTGALTAALLRAAGPQLVVGCDPSEAFIDHARRSIDAPQARFEVAGIDRLPRITPGFDAVVSGLVLNHLPSTEAALQEMSGVLRTGGMIAAYVWDYGDGMEFLRIFWEEAIDLDPAAAALNEGPRFPICREGGLADAFSRAGLAQVRMGEISIRTDFSSYADFWEPFENGVGPAGGYVAGLDQEQRGRLKDRLRKRLAQDGDGPIRLTARAWTACGVVDGDEAP